MAHSADIRVKRVYDDPAPEDGTRVLVDRLWPRGMRKDEAPLDEWLKAVAPSNELRRWYGHDHQKWQAFRTRYKHELEADDAAREALQRLRELAEGGTLTLLYSSRETEYNNAAALRDYLLGDI